MMMTVVVTMIVIITVPLLPMNRKKCSPTVSSLSFEMTML